MTLYCTLCWWMTLYCTLQDHSQCGVTVCGGAEFFARDNCVIMDTTVSSCQLGVGQLAAWGRGSWGRGSWGRGSWQLGSNGLVFRVSGAGWAGRWSTGLTTRAGRGQVRPGVEGG